MAIAINGSGTVTGISVGGLPDGIVDTDMIAAKAVTTAKSTGLGGVDQWRLHTNFDGDAVPITSNLERVDNGAPGQIGSAMSVSSGIWTFPTTGIWNIRFDRMVSIYNATNAWSETIIRCSTDNFTSNYTASDDYPALGHGVGTNHDYKYTGCNYNFDVVNTSTHKCRFDVNNQATNASSVRTYGHTDINLTYFTFVRLGDT